MSVSSSSCGQRRGQMEKDWSKEGARIEQFEKRTIVGKHIPFKRKTLLRECAWRKLTETTHKACRSGHKHTHAATHGWGPSLPVHRYREVSLMYISVKPLARLKPIKTDPCDLFFQVTESKARVANHLNLAPSIVTQPASQILPMKHSPVKPSSVAAP